MTIRLLPLGVVTQTHAIVPQPMLNFVFKSELPKVFIVQSKASRPLKVTVLMIRVFCMFWGNTLKLWLPFSNSLQELKACVCVQLLSRAHRLAAKDFAGTRGDSIIAHFRNGLYFGPFLFWGGYSTSIFWCTYPSATRWLAHTDK